VNELRSAHQIRRERNRDPRPPRRSSRWCLDCPAYPVVTYLHGQLHTVNIIHIDCRGPAMVDPDTWREMVGQPPPAVSFRV
jgi:hypothetical protein